MVAELNRTRFLDQATTVYQIRTRFGPKFTYDNEAGNLAIGRDVLREFRKLTAGTVVWESGEKVWRFRETYDPPGRKSD